MNERPLIRRQFSVDGHEIILKVPADPDDILAEAVQGETKDPYWGKVWDSAPLSAACAIKTSWPADCSTAIELGCGCGLLGIAAMFAGLEVTLSDHDQQAVELAIENARRNGFAKPRGIQLDWNFPPESQFDLALASDVLYEEELHQPLLGAARMLLKDNGRFCVGDPGRHSAKAFVGLANDSGWNVQIYDSELRPVLMPRTNEFQWLVLRS